MGTAESDELSELSSVDDAQEDSSDQCRGALGSLISRCRRLTSAQARHRWKSRLEMVTSAGIATLFLLVVARKSRARARQTFYRRRQQSYSLMSDLTVAIADASIPKPDIEQTGECRQYKKQRGHRHHHRHYQRRRSTLSDSDNFVFQQYRTSRDGGKRTRGKRGKLRHALLNSNSNGGRHGLDQSISAVERRLSAEQRKHTNALQQMRIGLSPWELVRGLRPDQITQDIELLTLSGALPTYT